VRLASRARPGAPAIERLVARLPVLLPLLGLALLAQVALGERDRPTLLWAGLPTALVLVAYLRAGRGRRRAPTRGETR